MGRAGPGVAAAALLAVVAGPLPAAAEYGWRISGSSDTPHENEGQPPPGPFHLYLWLECSSGDGMSAAEFALDPPPGVDVLEFAPRGGFLNGGTFRELQLAVGGCPAGPVLAGVWTLSAPAPGSYCLAAAAGRVVVGTVDCDPQRPSLHASHQVGYGAWSAPACDDGPLCATTGNVPESWGRMKGLYRN